MKHNRWIGAWGEQAAADFLTERGYRILRRNVRTPHGEIDIVAEYQDITIFVEVKTRTSAAMGRPEESITARKRTHMLEAAAYYAAEQSIDHWQVDAVSVEGAPGRPTVVTHFENAVQQ
jgi:putative endonuclease